MAKEKKVAAITARDADFTQWYTDVCTKAELIDYTSVKGMFIYRPYGYAIWAECIAGWLVSALVLVAGIIVKAISRKSAKAMAEAATAKAWDELDDNAEA